MILLGIFSGILDGLKSAGIWVVDQLVISFGFIVNAAVDASPAMPAAPDLGFASYLPDEVVKWFNFGNEYFPLSYLVGVLIPLILALWLVWIVVAIALRWGKVLRGSQ